MKMRTAFDSAEHPSCERLDRWQETARLALAPTVIRVDDPVTFQARMSHLDLGTVQLVSMAYSALRSARTPRMIRSSDPERYSVALILGGNQRISQADHVSLANAQDLTFFDTSHPFDAQVAPQGSSQARSVVAQFPKALLPARTFDRLLGARLSGRQGVGAMLAKVLTGLADETVDYRPSDAVRLAGILVDLITVTLARELDVEGETPLQTREHALVLCVLAYIDANLGDPGLSPAAIAAAHKVSDRHLHRLFKAQGMTVAAWIRRQRLDRCRRDLTDSRLRSRTVHSIATRYGFGDPAHFSRVFRAAYGMSPSECRERSSTSDLSA
ncbi:helix-turn-helix domain-containing protein [Streptomyces sp. NBC_00637]|uniref:helix-turn-helix domain-containing protein n=1 Tax=Streptomyces sp. NBC_00637 TaxID=2903667 RepID=UPI00324365F9